LSKFHSAHGARGDHGGRRCDFLDGFYQVSRATGAGTTEPCSTFASRPALGPFASLPQQRRDAKRTCGAERRATSRRRYDQRHRPGRLRREWPEL